MNLPDQHFSLQIIELVVHKETLQFLLPFVLGSGGSLQEKYRRKGMRGQGGQAAGVGKEKYGTGNKRIRKRSEAL